MQTEISVAEAEPRLAAERRHGLEGLPGLARTAPAALLVVQPGKRVEDGVEIGGHVHPEDVDVVADIAHDRHVCRPGDLDDAAHEPRAADASGEDDDLHGIAPTGSSSRQDC